MIRNDYDVYCIYFITVTAMLLHNERKKHNCLHGYRISDKACRHVFMDPLVLL